MDRAAALSALDAGLLQALSRRTVAALRAALPLRPVLPRLEPVLAENVAKEVRKDRLTIACAAQAVADGAHPARGAASRLLEEARRIDREFTAGLVGRFPIGLEIPYAAIEPLRRERIELGLDTAYRILAAWRRGARLREAFEREELRRRLLGILRLYAEETRALARGVRLPALIAPLRDRLAHGLAGAMAGAAESLAREAESRVFSERRRA